jgi:hypothetical protein
MHDGNWSNLKTMISTNTPRSLPTDAPAIIRELRDAFDQRLTNLHAVAQEKAPTARPGQGHDGTAMYHIDFPLGVLQVTAIYDSAQDRFTQLVARMAEEAHHERPSFTISLFL